MSGGVVGLDFQGLAVMLDGLVSLSATGQSQSQIVMGVCVAGLELQRLAVENDSLFDPPPAGQGIGKAHMGPHVARLDLQGSRK